MQDAKAKIHYLYHSGFAVETNNHFLIFDYYNDKPCVGKDGLSGGIMTAAEISTRENIVVFVSHGHGDHFNPVIFKWQKANPRIRYVISSDVSAKGDNIYSLAPYNRLDLGDLVVETFGSTDMGVSFLVSTDGLKIFHAGDLNLWHWKDESTDEEIKLAEDDFKREMDRIIGKKIDIAFFPVDPRLGSDYWLGAEKFKNLIKPMMLVPMHFGDKLEAASEFAMRAQDCDTAIPMILERGQVILFRKQNT